jgi:ATP-binding cassette subfamily B protein
MADGVRQGRGGIPVRPTTWRERLGALRNLPPFLAMVWGSSRTLTATTVAVRLVRALLPVATLFVGKLIIDEVVHLSPQLYTMMMEQRRSDGSDWNPY